MAIIGIHTLLYTSEPEKVRAILRDVFEFTHVEVHDGWLIFGLPPAEMGVHPAEPPHGFPERLLRSGKVAALLVDRGEIRQGPAVTARRADLVEHLQSLMEVALRLVRFGFTQAASLDGEGVPHRLAAPARLGERLGLVQQRDGAGDVPAHPRDGGELRPREAFEVGT